MMFKGFQFWDFWFIFIYIYWWAVGYLFSLVQIVMFSGPLDIVIYLSQPG